MTFLGVVVNFHLPERSPLSAEGAIIGAPEAPRGWGSGEGLALLGGLRERRNPVGSGAKPRPTTTLVNFRPKQMTLVALKIS